MSSNGTDTTATSRRSDRRNRQIFSSAGHLSEEARQHIGFVTEIISTTMETAIFAYLGLFLFSHRYHWNLIHTTTAILACCVSRAVMIPLLSFVANWIIKLQQHRAACRPASKREQQNAPPGVVIDKKMQLVLWFAGLRGAMSFALVEHIPLYDSVSGEGTRLKPELKAMTSACILFTVFILGGYTYYMMEYLGLAPKSPRARSSLQAPSYELAPLTGKVASGDEDDDVDLDLAQQRVYTKKESTVTGKKATLRRQRLTVLSTSDAVAPTDDLQQY